MAQQQAIQHTQNLERARGKLHAITKELNHHFYERHTEVRGLLVALLAREHVLLLGPPGAAKSELAEALCSRIETTTTDGYFSWLLSRTSTPEELFGPISIKALENDSYRRNTTGKLPEASIAFLDEVFKCNSAVLNSLLSILNERTYYNDSQATAVPLQMAVGASNELPADREELGAVYDRFMVRFEVSYMREEESFQALLARANNSAVHTTISEHELDTLRRQMANVDTTPIISEVCALRRGLTDAGIQVSDRRYARSIPLMTAHAVMEGRNSLTGEDLELLADVLWTEPNQRKTVAQKVMERANPQLGKAQDLLDEAEEIYRDALAVIEDQQMPQKKKSDNITEKHTKLMAIINRLLEIKQEANAAGRSGARIDDNLARVNAMNKYVLQKGLGILA